MPTRMKSLRAIAAAGPSLSGRVIGEGRGIITSLSRVFGSRRYGGTGNTQGQSMIVEEEGR